MKKIGLIKRGLALFMAVLMLAAALAGCSGNLDVQKVRGGVARVLQMVRIDAYLPDENGMPSGDRLGVYIDSMAWGFGSCFGVGKSGKPTDIFVTNQHVVEDGGVADYAELEDGTEICLVPVRIGTYLLLDDHAYDSANGLDTNRAIPCDVIYEAGDGQPDIAILRAAEPVEDRIALPLYSGEVKQGDSVWALGFPGSSDIAAGADFKRQIEKLPSGLDSITVTDGTVSKIAYVEDEKADCIQSTAATNSGNSGGPLIGASGAVVGINTFLLPDETTPLYYALSVQEVRNALDSKGISYDTSSGGFSLPLIPIGIAGAAVLLIVIAVIVMKARKPSSTPAPEPIPEPIPQPAPVPQPPTPQPPAPEPVSPGGPRVQGESGHFMGRRFSIDGVVRIGRDPSKNDLVYPPDTQGVSGVHCQIARKGERLFLTDLGSTYGTFLGSGQRLAANESVELRVGDRFYLGSERQMFRIAGKGGV